MSEEQSPLENALDLILYAPVGLAMTAIEEIPKLAAKGRAQVQGQLTIAKMVGQFAVAQGRREVEKRLGASQRKPAGPAAQPAEEAHPDGGYGRLSGRAGDDEPTGTDAGPAPSAGDGVPGAADNGAGALVADEPFFGVPGAASPGASAAPAPGPSAAPASGPEGLAIPGYDSLSASQVVQRLAGLSQDELDAVGSYEAAHRARRTILTRVNQLKA